MTAGAPAEAVRIGTWNVQYGRGVEKNRLRAAHLRSLAADVWVLTETHDELDLSSSHVPVHSEQRYASPGGRWTSIWTSLPVIEQLATSDPHRSVAVRLSDDARGEMIVYGTVLPWNGDRGPDLEKPAKGWEEFHRVVPEQGQDWALLRDRFPDAALVVAGDLNQDLGGEHYYGTKAGRRLLLDELSKARIACLTTTDRFDRSVLLHPPIDHVCAGAGAGAALQAEVLGWNRDVGGVRLSDHGGVLAEVTIRASDAANRLSSWPSPSERAPRVNLSSGHARPGGNMA